MPAASLEVSKTLQYDVLGPPSAAVSISKTLNYDVLKPIASAVNVSKFIQYVVVSSGAGTLCVADLYFSPSGQFFDLTDPNNRGVFHSPTGGANWLGGQASIPLSAPAPIWLSAQGGYPADLATNYGNAGPFTLYNALTFCGGGNPPLGNQPYSQNKLIFFNGRHWWTGNQESNLTYIGAQEVNADFNMYGTDGKSVFPICQNTAANLTKTVVSKLWTDPGGPETTKHATRLWTVSKTISSAPPVLTVTADNESGSTTVVASKPLLTNQGFWQYSYDVPQSGYMMGLTIQTLEPDIVLVAAAVGVQMYNFRL